MHSNGGSTGHLDIGRGQPLSILTPLALFRLRGSVGESHSQTEQRVHMDGVMKRIGMIRSTRRLTWRGTRGRVQSVLFLLRTGPKLGYRVGE